MKLDFSGLKEQLMAVTAEQIKQIKEALQPTKAPEGKGLILPPDKTSKLLESFKGVSSDTWVMKEQWTVPIPLKRTAELPGGLRDYVYTTELLKTEAGDVANIPYVGDFDFTQLSAVGDAITTTVAAQTICYYVSTTLYEAAAYADIGYNLIERYDSNLLEMINQAFATAGLRAEDNKIMALVEALTSTNFGYDMKWRWDATGTLSTRAAYFYATNIPTALGWLMSLGKSVTPGQCLLYMTPMTYKALIEEVASNTAITYAQPSLVVQGVIETLFGVKIYVGPYRSSQQRTNAATGTVDLCFLMRPKRAIALAPKRDILIETDKQIATRKLRVTASHTFGLAIMDAKEIIRIWTSRRA